MAGDSTSKEQMLIRINTKDRTYFSYKNKELVLALNVLQTLVRDADEETDKLMKMNRVNQLRKFLNYNLQPLIDNQQDFLHDWNLLVDVDYKSTI